jgi:predicted amidohydrolase YtcJ
MTIESDNITNIKVVETIKEGKTVFNAAGK